MSSPKFAAFSEAARPIAGEEAVAAFIAFVRERRRPCRIEAGFLARDLGLDADELSDMLEVAVDPEVRLLEPQPQIRCPHCQAKADEAVLRDAEDEEGAAECPDCGREIELASLKAEDTYDLTEEADAEAAAYQECVAARPEKRGLFLCALDVELEQLLAQMKQDGRSEVARHTTTDGTAYWTVDLEGEFIDWTVAAAATGTGNAEAAAGAIAAIGDFSPDSAIYLGVAGGIEEKDAALGDVVVANDVHDYSKGKSIDDGFISHASQVQAAFALVQHARGVKIDGRWKNRIREVQKGLASTSPGVHLEPIAAGNHVVAGLRGETYKLVRALAGRAVAVEMEGAGFLGAMHRAPQVQAGVVRGISDLVSDKELADKLGWQRQAAANAAAFGFELLASEQIPRKTL